MWNGNEFIYSKRLLQAITQHYETIYEGLPLSSGTLVTNPWALAEFRADFDMALSGIGRCKWEGINGHKFKDFRMFGKLQRLIIAEIMGIEDWELYDLHFKDVPRLRGYAYYLMCCFLNKGEIEADVSED